MFIPKHNEVLDSKCQTCNLLLLSGFVVRVCLPTAVFLVGKQAALLCCLHQRFSGATNGAATGAARPSTRPTGKLWIGWSCSAGFLKTRQLVMQQWRLEFSRGCCFTSGQGRIDLRFRRSMLSVQVLRGSSRECQQGSKRITVTIFCWKLSDASLSPQFATANSKLQMQC